MSAPNTLYYGDNLDVLRRHIADESVDLVYLDPPFNSNANYNVLFAAKDGTESAAQIQAFEDTWEWNADAARQYAETVETGGPVSEALQAFRQLLGTNNMLSYLTMMAPRLVELHRVLKDTGSLYLHCDPTASHYLKLLLDSVFGPSGFINEIVWKRHSAHNDAGQGAKHFGRLQDVLLMYAKGPGYLWKQLYVPYDPEYVAKFYRHVEAGSGRRYRLSDITAPGGASPEKRNPHYEFLGVTRYWRFSQARMQELYEQGRIVQTKPGRVPAQKRYLDEMPGTPVGTWWEDIKPVQAQSQERLGYPTQKPVALLDRIISASSNEGDVVLDPFCGCGTTIDAAERLGRQWIGIDITHLAVSLIKTRLRDSFGDMARYTVIGEPTTAEDAAALAESDKYQFQWWALGLVGARPVDQRKGADGGIDGRLYFHDGSGQTRQVVISVKGGKLKADDVRALEAVRSREKADIGVLLSFQPATKPMRQDAASMGFYDSPWGKHPRLQLLTVAEVLGDKRIDYPQTAGINQTYKQAPKVRKVAERVRGLFDKDAPAE